MKSVQIRSFFWSIFSRIRTKYGEIRSIPPYSVRMRGNTDQEKLRIWTLFTQFSDDFRGNRSKLIHLNLLNIRTKICRWSYFFQQPDWFLLFLETANSRALFCKYVQILNYLIKKMPNISLLSTTWYVLKIANRAFYIESNHLTWSLTPLRTYSGHFMWAIVHV